MRNQLAMAMISIGLLALTGLAGCVASGNGSPGADDDVVRTAEDGSAKVTWSIPVHQQPPLLDGGASVLTGVALGRFNARVGRYLFDGTLLYEGTASFDAGELGGFAQAEVVVTHLELPSLYMQGVSFEGAVHELDVYAGSTKPHARIWQDATWAELPQDLLPGSGLGSAWIALMLSPSMETLRGRCISCMTILREHPADTIVVQTEDIDPVDGAIVPMHVDGELRRVAPEDVTLQTLERIWRAQGDALAAPSAAEFHETLPGRWEREQLDETYLRCKEGGSRLVDFKTTWRLEVGNPQGSGILDIEVFDAAECEAFDYGGGS